MFIVIKIINRESFAEKINECSCHIYMYIYIYIYIYIYGDIYIYIIFVIDSTIALHLC